MRVRIVALGVVLRRVVGVQERPAVEEQAAGPLPAADDADGVGRVAPLGPDLGQVLGPALDVLPGGGEGQRQRGRLEPPAALVGVRGRRPRSIGRLAGLELAPGATRAGGPGRRT